MEKFQKGLIAKYFEFIDEFLVVNAFDRKAGVEVLEIDGVPTAAEYREAVIRTCMDADFDGVVEPRLKKASKEYGFDVGGMMDEIYGACVEVNPQLRIEKVRIPLRGAAVKSGKSRSRRVVEQDLAAFESGLYEDIIGQDHAIGPIVRAVRRDFRGLRPGAGPVGCFLLMGPTGVGKTGTANAAARAGRLFHGPVRVNCGEYQKSHEYAKLIGAPPGYLGHDDGGLLTNSVGSTPNSVVLMDEVEKAHPDIQNILLGVLDDGVMRDNKGKPVNFGHSLILLTSNLGSKEAGAYRGRVGFDLKRRQKVPDKEMEGVYMGAAKAAFRPEFLNRMDGVLVYRPFSEGVATGIARKLMTEECMPYFARGVSVSWSRAAERAVLRESDYREYGARDMRRVVGKAIDPLLELFSAGDIREGSEVSIGYRGGKFVFNY